MTGIASPPIPTGPARPAGAPISGIPDKPFPRLLALTGAVILVAAIWSIVKVDAAWGKVFSGPGELWRLGQLMVERATWADFTKCIRSMWDSVAMAWLGTLLAAVVAVPLSFFAAENLVPRWFSFGVRQLFNVLRAIPEIVLVIALVPAFGLTTTAGVMAIAIGSIGTLAKLCSEIVEGIDPGPVEAVDSVGATGVQRLRWGVVPQVLPEITSFLLYRFEINIRVSAILGVVGAGGIGNELTQGFQFKQWGLAGSALAVTVGITIVVDLVSGWVRRRILAGPPGARHIDESANRTMMPEMMIVMDTPGRLTI